LDFAAVGRLIFGFVFFIGVDRGAVDFVNWAALALVYGPSLRTAERDRAAAGIMGVKTAVLAIRRGSELIYVHDADLAREYLCGSGARCTMPVDVDIIKEKKDKQFVSGSVVSAAGADAGGCDGSSRKRRKRRRRRPGFTHVPDSDTAVSFSSPSIDVCGGPPGGSGAGGADSLAVDTMAKLSREGPGLVCCASAVCGDGGAGLALMSIALLVGARGASCGVTSVSISRGFLEEIVSLLEIKGMQVVSLDSGFAEFLQ